jgi:hypothetical protein
MKSTTSGNPFFMQSSQDFSCFVKGKTSGNPFFMQLSQDFSWFMKSTTSGNPFFMQLSQDISCFLTFSSAYNTALTGKFILYVNRLFPDSSLYVYKGEKYITHTYELRLYEYILNLGGFR